MSGLNYTFRTLARNPGFTLVAVATFALGIGASTAVFSVANSVLFKPLPYKEPDRLVLAYGDWRKRDVHDYPFSSADFFDLRAGVNAFEDTAAFSTGRMIAPKTDGSIEELKWASITPNFLGLMGSPLMAGRNLTDADGVPPPAPGSIGRPRPRATLLSYEYWQRRFGGDFSVLGRGVPGMPPGSTEIIGILAPGFELLLPAAANIERAPDLWFAARLAYDGDRRNATSLRIVARLKPAASLQQARAQGEAVAQRIRSTDAVHGSADFHFRMEPMGANLVAESRLTILALLIAATFLLAIACANVASLVIVRTSWRRRELALRIALGGSRLQIARLLFLEAVAVSGIGAMLGTATSYLGIRVLLRLAPSSLPRVESIAMDPWAFLFVIGAGASAVFLFGLTATWHGVRADAPDILRGGRGNGSQRTPILRNGIAILQVALSFVLLVGSGLLLRSFVALRNVDLGYDPGHVITFQLLGNRGGAQPAERALFQRTFAEKMRSIPGVLNVGATNPLPLAGGFNATRWGTADALSDPSKFQSADFQMVLPGYFETLHSRFVAGRSFRESDNTPNSRAVVIDDLLAAKAFPNQDAIGKRFLFLLARPQPEWVEVVGVVAHQRATSIHETGREQIYITDGYMGHGAVSRWTLRTPATQPAL